MPTPYGLSDLVAEMRRVTAAETSDPARIVARLAQPARRLALARDWLEPRFYQGNEAQGFEIFSLHEEPDHSLSVIVASLLPGRSLVPHNHNTWAIAVGIDGYETNIAWRRQDDGSRPGYAEIVPSSRGVFGPGEVLTFLPPDIHSVVNESDRLSLSLNLYGVSFAYAHSSQFDPLARTERPLIPDAPGA